MPLKNQSARALRGAALATLLIALAVVARMIGQEGPVECHGIQARAGQNLVQVVREAPAGATVCIKGFHRISETITPKSGMTLQGAPGAVVSGAREVADFSPRGTLYAFPLLGPPPGRQSGRECTNYPLNCYRFGVFLDGIALTHVPRQQLRPGTFFLDRARGEILLADNPAGRDLEVTEAPSIIGGRAPDVTLQNLVVEQAAGNGILAGGPQWQMLDVESRWNHAAGVRAISSDYVVRGGHVHHNGQFGFTGGGSDGLIEAVEIDHNDQLRFGTNLSNGAACWDAGEAKWVSSENLTIRDNYVHDGFCNGLWLDINNQGTVIEGNRIEDNAGIGLIQEIGFDTTIRDNLVRANGYFNIEVASSSKVHILGNNIRGPGILILQQTLAGAPRTGWCLQGQTPPCERITRDILASDNSIACARTCVAARSGGYEPFWDNGISFDGNRYHVQNGVDDAWILGRSRVSFETWVARGFDTTSELAGS